VNFVRPLPHGPALPTTSALAQFGEYGAHRPSREIFAGFISSMIGFLRIIISMQRTKQTLLGRYPVLHSQDSEVARERLFSTYGAVGFERSKNGFGLQANYIQLSDVGLSYCGYDHPVTLEFPESGIVRQFFSLTGSAAFSSRDSAAVTIGPWTPAISGSGKLRLDFGESYSQLVLRIDATGLERTVKALVGDSSDRKLEFLARNEDVAGLSAIRKSVLELAAELDRFGTAYSPLAIAELERMLLIRFLFSHQHSFSHLLWREPRTANRSVVDTVEAFIEANWDKPLDVGELADVANVSVRTLFREFLRAGKSSPAEFAKRVRLQHANSLLRANSNASTVTGVALRCGFQNVGRFARDYSFLFGELPSETLKRANGS
jgi:AraC-like DNA-binding protein